MTFTSDKKIAARAKTLFVYVTINWMRWANGLHYDISVGTKNQETCQMTGSHYIAMEADEKKSIGFIPLAVSWIQLRGNRCPTYNYFCQHMQPFPYDKTTNSHQYKSFKLIWYRSWDGWKYHLLIVLCHDLIDAHRNKEHTKRKKQRYRDICYLLHSTGRQVLGHGYCWS